jgi:hypothetical protein
VPLSDEEARLLHQLEQSLAAEDPDFASTLRGSKLLASSKRLAVLSAVGFLAGLGVLLAGAVMARTWLGVAGFVVMIAAAYLFVSVNRQRLGAPGPRTPSAAKSNSSFVDRMEERWQRRQDSDDF